MLTIRRSEDRGHAEIGWLDSYHTFSFSNYFDPSHMGFRALRVINDDTVAPGRGFGSHAHRDMEILTYVLSGQLRHKDSMGEERVFGPNVVQAMSAGTGVVHSEFNASETEPVHFLQIWIEPSDEDFPPAYQQYPFEPEEKAGRLKLLAAPDASPADKAALIHQDAYVYVSAVGASEVVRHDMRSGRYGWVQVALGDVSVNGKTLAAGDGISLADESTVTITGNGAAGGEVLLFDLG